VKERNLTFRILKTTLVTQSAKYRALLAKIYKPKEEKEIEMEITWGVGSKGI